VHGVFGAERAELDLLFREAKVKLLRQLLRNIATPLRVYYL
jgi:hypothetical protein